MVEYPLTIKFDPVRWSLVSEIDEKIQSWSPNNLDGERERFFNTVLEWLKNWVGEQWWNSMELETYEFDDPLRYLITLQGERGYVIAIHDPMQGGIGSAESVTGADYSVQFPISDDKERFLFVQAKRNNYPVKPKQYFAFGGFYMFLQYIVNDNLWRSRLQQEGEYVTKREVSHQEPFFVSIYFDNEEVYIPLSSILRTFEKSTYHVDNQLTAKARLWVDKHTGTFAEFSNFDQHLGPYFRSFDEFFLAAESGLIGLTHSSEESVTERKMEGVMHLADTLMRPNINIIEVRQEEIVTYVDVLS